MPMQTITAQTTVTDSAGNQYKITNNTIQKYNAANTHVFTITPDRLGLNSFMPVALALDINNNLFIADNSLGKIFKISPQSYYLTELPGPSDLEALFCNNWQNLEGLPGIDHPNAVSSDASGNLMIANKNGSEILKLAPGRGVIQVSDIIAEIRVPYEDSLLYAFIPIIGTAAAKKFKKYTVEYGYGENPTQWTTIITSATEVYDDYQPIPHTRTIYGNLATFEITDDAYDRTGGLPIGTYTIRLKVYDKDENYKEDLVHVEVARVIGRSWWDQWAGTVPSNDGKVTLRFPNGAIADDNDLFLIKTADSNSMPPVAEFGLIQIGEIYEIKPAGYKFLKPCTLSLYYTDADLGSTSENTLNLFRWNPVTSQWVYVDATLDKADNVLTTEISKFNGYEVYYAVMSRLPSTPVIYPPDSPTPLKTITVYGKADPGINVEISVNGISKGTTSADEDTGYFAKTNIPLNTGENQITAKTLDPSGNGSAMSSPVSVQVVLSQPTSVDSLAFKNENFSSDFTGDAAIGDSLYIELTGTDADPASVNSAIVTLKSTTDTTGISIQVLETAPNSGIYHGTAKISETGKISTAAIGVSPAADTITATADTDPSKQDSVNTKDIVPPPAPAITSTTHPSLCQNTFEIGLDEWQNMSDTYGATIVRTGETAASGNYAVRMVNAEQGGDFANYARITDFDAKKYPIVSFDYKIPPGLKVNLVAYVNGMWKEIVFTDDPKTVETFEDDLYRTIGIIEEVQADNAWHHAEFNLYNMLKNDDPTQSQYIVEELFFADYNLPGWMELIMGDENPEDTAWHADNFIISEGGKSDNNPVFVILPNDSGVVGYSHVLDQYPGTIPDQTSEGDSNTITYNNVADGAWNFHIRSLDSGGNWGPANHYQIKVDTDGPSADSPEPADGSSSGSLEARVSITDGAGSGVDPDTIQLKLNNVTYSMSSGGLSYDEKTETLIFSLWKVTPVQSPWTDGSIIQASVISANDFAGNPIQQIFSWSWTVDYSDLAGGQISLLTTQGGYTPTWSPDSTKIAFMSERSGNKDIWIINSDDYAEASGTVEQLTSHEKNDHHPAWSPKDNQIAFVSDRNGTDHIYIIHADGTGLTQLTTGNEDDSHPVWHPDSSKIAFSRAGEIRMINSDGTGETQITYDSIEYYLEPSWSSDGSSIAFRKSLYSEDIAVMDANGENQQTLTTEGDNFFPAWSYETGQIIFVTRREEKPDAIWIVNSNGSSEKRYIDNENLWWDSEPEQSRLSDKIAFQSTRNGIWNIWIKTQLEITDVTALPEIFSPNNDGINDTVKITFNLTEGSAQIDLIIYDAAGNPVATLLDHELAEAGQNTVIWDGADDSGEIAESGTYTFKLTIKGSAGASTIEKTGLITLDIAPPSFSGWIIQLFENNALNISVAIEDETDINTNTAKLQYGIASSASETAPDIIGWTDEQLQLEQLPWTGLITAVNTCISGLMQKMDREMSHTLIYRKDQSVISGMRIFPAILTSAELLT